MVDEEATAAAAGIPSGFPHQSSSKKFKADLSVSIDPSPSHSILQTPTNQYAQASLSTHPEYLFANPSEESNQHQKYYSVPSASAAFSATPAFSDAGLSPSATDSTPMLLYPYEEGGYQHGQIDMDGFAPNPASQTGSDGPGFGGSIHRSIPSDSLSVHAYSELAHALGPFNRPGTTHVSGPSTSSD